MRIILKCLKRTLQWLSIKQRIYFNTLVLIFKVVNNLLQNYTSMSEKLHLNADIDNMITMKPEIVWITDYQN